MRRRDFVTLLAARRRRGRSARKRSRAEAADYRAFSRGHGRGPERMDRRFCGAPARTRLDRRTTVAIEYRWAGDAANACRVRSRVCPTEIRCYPTHNTPPVLAAKQATSVIPIVFARRPTELVPASWPVWRDQAATSPDCRARVQILLANGSNFYGRLSRSSTIGDFGQSRQSLCRL